MACLMLMKLPALLAGMLLLLVAVEACAGLQLLEDAMMADVSEAATLQAAHCSTH